MKGATVCRMHGGKAPRTYAKSQARVAISQLMNRPLTDEERRHPWEIVVDAVQRLDQAMTSGTWDSEGAYLEHVVQVVKVGKLLIDANVAEKMANARTREVEQLGQQLLAAFTGVIERLLDALLPAPAQVADSNAYARALVEHQRQHEAMRQWALALVASIVADQPAPAAPALAASDSRVIEA